MIKKLVISYLKFIGKETGFKREKVVRSLLPKEKNFEYLDLGCGDGLLTMERAQIIGTDNICGVEILQSEIKKARDRGIIVKKADLNKKFPFQDKQFDIITATQVIEHLYDLDTFVAEVYRILKKGGILIISTENLSAWHNIFALVLGLQPSAGPFISNKFSVGFHPLAAEHKKAHKIFPYLKLMVGHTRVMAYRSFEELFRHYKFIVLNDKGVGYYPFPSFISSFFSEIDRWHSLDVILKLKK